MKNSKLIFLGCILAVGLVNGADDPVLAALRSRTGVVARLAAKAKTEWCADSEVAKASSDLDGLVEKARALNAEINFATTLVSRTTDLTLESEKIAYFSTMLDELTLGFRSVVIALPKHLVKGAPSVKMELLSKQLAITTRILQEYAEKFRGLKAECS
ncbi:hypothetical protein HN446_03985 [bacterium]|jgi:hypothetical protein|nr:hypothetical protein [bacterium]